VFSPIHDLYRRDWSHRYAWVPEGERPTLLVTGTWESLKLLGGVTDDGGTFFLPCEDNFTSDLTIRLLDALQTKFGEKLCVVLDNASYFAANKVQDFAEDTPLELCYLPRGSPELNLTEECWHRLSQRLRTASSRNSTFFETLLSRYDHPRPIVVEAVEKTFCTLPASTDDDFLVADLEP
jgi:hypothetical protein